MWRRVGDSLGDPIAVGGFAYRPDRDPGGPWSGFPALLLRVPELAGMRGRGPTYAPAVSAHAEALLRLNAPGPRPPAARSLEVASVRHPHALTAAAGAAAR